MAQRKPKGGVTIDIPPHPDFLETNKYNHPKSNRTQQQHPLKLAIPVLVLMIVVWGDVGLFWYNARQCIFNLPDDSSSHILIVSDPQLTDKFSYWDYGSLWPVVEYYSDVYMQRYFWTFTRQQRFIATIFLGDLFDGVTAIMKNKEGRAQWTAGEYQKLKKRWEWVFPDNPDTKRIYVAGNHDIGYKIENAGLKQTWKENFGPLNFIERIEDWNFVVIASTLTGEQSKDTDELWALVEEAKPKEGELGKNVLLSHIPLYRPSTATCGPNERGLGLDIGYSYTTMLTPQDTQRLLKLRPKLALSGDVHKPCHYQHNPDQGPTDEYTINTFSWTQGNIFPGTSIISLRSEGIDHTLCTFHNQLNVFKFYGMMGVIVFALCILSEKTPNISLLQTFKQGIRYFIFIFLVYFLLFYIFLQWIFL